MFSSRADIDKQVEPSFHTSPLFTAPVTKSSKPSKIVLSNFFAYH